MKIGIFTALFHDKPFEEALDLIAGARTSLGKGILIIGGMIAGYYFGVKSKKVVTNEEA